MRRMTRFLSLSILASTMAFTVACGSSDAAETLTLDGAATESVSQLEEEVSAPVESISTDEIELSLSAKTEHQITENPDETNSASVQTNTPSEDGNTEHIQEENDYQTEDQNEDQSEYWLEDEDEWTYFGDEDSQNQSGQGYCTVSIECNDIYNYPDDFTGNWSYVPAAGDWILEPVSVPVYANESAMDVTKRALDTYGISSTIRSGSYISAIGGLKEKDCGPSSGWTVYVNDYFITRSAAEWSVSAGDTIAWEYSCRAFDE